MDRVFVSPLPVAPSGQDHTPSIRTRFHLLFLKFFTQCIDLVHFSLKQCIHCLHEIGLKILVAAAEIADQAIVDPFCPLADYKNYLGIAEVVIQQIAQ